MIIRTMEEKDFNEVYLLEQTLYKNPWSKEMFHQEINTNRYAYMFVAEEFGRIIGYYGLWMVMDEAMVTKVSVMQPLQGKGIGHILMQDLLKRVQQAGCVKISLEVRVHNAAAIHLYEAYGFQKVAVRKQYYPDLEDAYTMIKLIEEEGQDGSIYSGH